MEKKEKEKSSSKKDVDINPRETRHHLWTAGMTQGQAKDWENGWEREREARK